MIISYEMFKKHIDLINEVTSLEVLVLDEAHKIKSASENKTNAAMRSCIATRRLLLTGSPIQNNLEELYSLINFAAPGYLGNISSFRRRYVHPIQEGSGEDASSADKQEAKQSADKLRGILSQIMIRRTQSEVLKHLLPPRTDVVLFLRLHEKQESRYDDVANSMIGTSRSWMDKSSTTGEGDEAEEEEVPFVPTEMVLPSLQSLRRIVNYLEEGEMAESVSAVSLSRALPATSDFPHPHPMAAPQDAQPGNKFKPPPRVAPPILVGVKAAAPAPKVAPDIKALLASSSKLTVLDSLWSVMRTHCPQEKCVVVSNFVTTLEKVQQLAEARGYEALLLQGNVAIDHRQSLVDRFNRASDPAFLFLLSSRAGGVGINLPGGSRLVQMDCDWNPAVDLQAMSRIWRDGQTRKTFIYRLCARGYVEETILQRQYQKGTLVTSCLDDPSAPSIGHVDATAQGEDELAIAAPKSKRDLEALIFPRYSETTADSNLGKTLLAPYETDPLLQHLLESTAGGELVTDIVECTR
jgi:SNF2 family DNA or RNA helicase